ncbi:Pentulose kinase [Dacryopinax primogenitus]|uniref:Pentulose kinase n=1 Tax=Dacryopinax primogenitus (strain DJM 731) TaxID=1858805 RepID=M5GFB6_DACPD|nr:Pentulose kinase [Dacryopinax primogenitus]EJU06122.1 Pentulose kinase [Dacryopinax primogenitus]
MSKGPHYIGIDVGTGSARAALLDISGKIIADSTHETRTWRDTRDHRIFEQSTTDIWASICQCVRDVLSESGVPPEDVKGVGVDATCSLAVTDEHGGPVCVTGGKECGGQGERNIILWADHRAEEEALLINSTGSKVLDYVGGTMSLEMEIPKILWLKKHMPASEFAKCMFFDLPDFLTYRLTGSLARSNCSLVCKCSFVPVGVEGSEGWNAQFLSQIGLDDVVQQGYEQIGGTSGKNGMVLTAGQAVGTGLSAQAAKELGLMAGTTVGSAVIDAYAGWIGTVAGRFTQGSGGELSPQPKLRDSRGRLAAIAGTSTCHIVQSEQGVFVPGVWGPYKNAVFPGWWMNEGGQSSTGQLIDFMIKTHPAYEELKKLAEERKTNIFDVLASTLDDLKKEAGTTSLTYLTKDLHFYPDLHGNRSPLADPRMRGSIVGLALDSGLGDLALKFNVTLEAIALQTRHIIEEMNVHGHKIDSIYMSGSQAKNAALMQLLADVCDVPVILPHSPSAAVVVGAAMLGRFAAEVGARTGDLKTHEEAERVSEQTKEDLWQIMIDMTQPGKQVAPSSSPADKKLLDAKYHIFRQAIDIQRSWRKLMEEAAK